jgi:pectate lyase
MTEKKFKNSFRAIVSDYLRLRASDTPQEAGLVESRRSCVSQNTIFAIVVRTICFCRPSLQHMCRLLVYAGILALSSSVFAVDAPAVPAFPGAEGFGAYSQGGRGGRVLHVTTLADEGSGSLRWAVEQEGPRTIVFEVSGTIELKERLTIRNPFITIAGQTAPGDGICLRHGMLGIATHDVIVRYLRCRMGGQGRGGDDITIGKGADIILDHCSASWSTDEVLSASTRNPTLTRVTVQWSFITGALNPKGHSFGSLIRGTGGAKYSFLHNLYAHNRGRNPRPGNYDSNPHDKDPEGLLLDFRNNVIYNWAGGHAGYNNDSISVIRLNYVGNYLIPGADSEVTGIAYSTSSPYNRAFFAGNMYNNQLPDDPWDVVKYHRDWTDDIICAYKHSQPFETGPIQKEDARTAFQRVMRSGGAGRPC